MEKKTQKTLVIGVVLMVALAAVSYTVWSSGSGGGHGVPTIVGIDPGAGIMGLTEDVLEEYGLADAGWELQSSSSAGMLTALTKAYAKENPIVVTLWTPHWAFEKFDLKMLEDPQGIYGDAEHVQTLARQGFQEDNPGAYAIIERFSWTQDDIQSVMVDIYNGMAEEAAAQKWIDANRDTVDYWIGEDDSSGSGGDDNTINFGYVLWEGEIASTNVLTLVLEEAGFDVEMINVDAGILYQSLAGGDLDITTSAWLPVTQADYWAEYGDRIVSVATNLEGCTVGLFVPTYMTDVNSISDLIEHSEMFEIDR